MSPTMHNSRSNWGGKLSATGAGVLAMTLLVAGCNHSGTSSAKSALTSASTAGGPEAISGGAGASGVGGAGAGASGGAGGTATSAGTPVNGGEIGTGAAGPTCKLTSPADVATAFATKVIDTKATTSAVGNPLCVFTLAATKTVSGGTVIMSLNASTSSSEFSAEELAAVGAVPLTGIGDAAFYLPSTYTLRAARGTKAVSVQAQIGTPGTAERAAALQGQLVAITKVVIAQL